MEGKLIKESEDRFKLYANNVLFGVTREFDAYGGQSPIHTLSKKNCEEEFAKAMGVVDVDKLATQHLIDKNCASLHTSWQGYNENTYKDGFNKAMELNKDKVFTLEDMLNLIDNIGFVKTTSEELNSKDYQPFITDEDGEVWTFNKDELIQSLQQPTEIEVIIDTEMSLIGQCDCLCHKEGVRVMHIKACCNPTMVEIPKFNEDGFLILKRK